MKILMLTDYDAGGTWNIAAPLRDALPEHEITLRSVGKGERIADLSKTLEEWDVVHFWNIRTRQYFDPAPPTVITIHHLLPPPRDLKQYDALREWLPERIHVVDRFTQHGLGRAGFTNVTHIPQAFDHSRWKKLPPPAEFTLGYLGDPYSDKRFEVIEAIAAELGVPCLGIKSNPWQPDEKIEEFYKAISVFVVASFCDGGPLPAQEALLCGRPVVSTRVGMMDMVLRHGNGLFFDGSVEDGVRVVKTIRDDYAYYHRGAADTRLPRVLGVNHEYERLYRSLNA